jgi:hypothetical protein
VKKKSRATRRQRSKHKAQSVKIDKVTSVPISSVSLLTAPAEELQTPEQTSIDQGELVAYDENLLERTRTQWQFGDWDSLAKLERNMLQHHPDRAKLALLAAAGHLQLGDTNAARQFTRLAQDWGCSKKLVSQLLISGVHNTLGRAAVVSGQQLHALKHFESAISVVVPTGEIRLLTRARTNEQLEQLELHTTNLNLLQKNNTNTRRDLVNRDAIEEPPAWLVKLVDDCFVMDDVLEAIDHVLMQNKLNDQESFFFFIHISDRFCKLNDKITAISFLNSAREHANNINENLRTLLPKKFIELGRPDEAIDLLVRSSLNQTSEVNLNNEDKQALEQAYNKTTNSQKSKNQHGHELLLSYLKEHFTKLVGNLQGRKPVLIEIGTTRENLPGQGSTRKIAEFCHAKTLHFITVDMDPHNTFVAANMFKELNLSFEAITMKGEDYLRDYDGSFDFIFLDAYDFDHGGHSKLRQSRYQKFLGASIDDTECHRMHLDCAKSVVNKLSAHGLVCVDDTWLEDGRWTAKGTLAMPYLLENGFHVLEARNRAALLVRSNETAIDSSAR